MTTTCHECGLTFVPSDEAARKEHDRIHARLDRARASGLDLAPFGDIEPALRRAAEAAQAADNTLDSLEELVSWYYQRSVWRAVKLGNWRRHAPKARYFSAWAFGDRRDDIWRERHPYKPTHKMGLGRTFWDC